MIGATHLSNYQMFQSHVVDSFAQLKGLQTVGAAL